MFFCEQCRQDNHWPPYDWMKEICPKSNGTCEMCKKKAICYDLPSSQLPAKHRATHITIKKSEIEAVYGGSRAPGQTRSIKRKIRKAAMFKRNTHLKLPDRSKDDGENSTNT